MRLVFQRADRSPLNLQIVLRVDLRDLIAFPRAVVDGLVAAFRMDLPTVDTELDAIESVPRLSPFSIVRIGRGKVLRRMCVVNVCRASGASARECRGGGNTAFQLRDWGFAAGTGPLSPNAIKAMVPHRP